MILKARWILPITSPPIENGAIVIEGDRITAIEAAQNFASAEMEDLDGAIIMPGLVNSHTHLELSHLQGLINKPRDLPEWLLRILAHQQDLSKVELEKLTPRAIEKGVDECLNVGVSTLGDISRFCHLTRLLLKRGPLRIVSYGEVLGIGTRRHLVADRLRIAANREHNSEFLTAALSPHAPYSVETAGAKSIIEQARLYDMQTCIHLAETVEEIQFLQTGQGRFREMLEMIGIWDDKIDILPKTPVRWAHALNLLGPECLIAHGNYLDEDEIDLLCASGASVAYCPRTHAYFGHQPHPLMKLIGGGVNVCVGTDSLGSAPSLSVLEELIMIHELYPELSADIILALGTINGARALGLAQSVGSLQKGKKADLAIFWSETNRLDQPEEALLSGQAELQRFYINGSRVR